MPHSIVPTTWSRRSIRNTLVPLLFTASSIVFGQSAFDDFERSNLGPDWTVHFGGAAVGITNSSDVGFPGTSGFFGLLSWTATSFPAEQYCEAMISPDRIDSVLCQVYVRRRSSDAARYGFHWNNAFGGRWEIKYDGVPTPQVRILAQQAGPPPLPGDTLRIEAQGMSLTGYLNGVLLLSATDTAFNTSAPITGTGTPGLAFRFTTTFPPVFPISAFEWWRGGQLLTTGLSNIEAADHFSIHPVPMRNSANVMLHHNLGRDMARLELYNQAGQRVRTFTINGTTATIERGDLGAGVYVARLVVNGQVRDARTLIVE